MTMGNQLSSRIFIIISAGGHVARGLPNEVPLVVIWFEWQLMNQMVKNEIAAHYNPD